MKAFRIYIWVWEAYYSVTGQRPDQAADPFKITLFAQSYAVVSSIQKLLAGGILVYNMPSIMCELLKKSKALHDGDTSIISSDWLAQVTYHRYGEKGHFKWNCLVVDDVTVYQPKMNVCATNSNKVASH